MPEFSTAELVELIVASRDAAAEQVRACAVEDREIGEKMLRAFDRVRWILEQHDRLWGIANP